MNSPILLLLIITGTTNKPKKKEKKNEKKKVIIEDNHPVEVCQTMTDQNTSKPQKIAVKVENSLRHK